MKKKPKKPYKPPVAAPAADPAPEPTKAPAPRVKRVREVPLSAKEQARAAKKAARARWMLRNP